MKRSVSKPVSPAQIERAARLAARRGAAILRKFYEKNVKISYKGAINLVTEADIQSQKTIVKTLSAAFPGHAILAEEEHCGHDRSLAGPIWVIDPLDGTTNYAHGFPMFAVSIAFRDGGETKFGLVYHPLLDELFIAHRGKGATLNERKIHVSKATRLDRSLLATGFPYDRKTSADNNFDLCNYFQMESLCVRRAGAATLDLANLACGRLDGFWEPKLAPWDIAAGMLLVEEAGGTTSGYDGKPLTDLWSGNIVASNSKIHADLIRGIRTVQKNR